MKEKITVLDHFNGVDIEVIETIERNITSKFVRAYDHGKQKYYWDKRKPAFYVIYKGEEYKLFHLKDYPRCISTRSICSL